ncbi:hypothetical protein [Schaalia sp. ZJ1691]|uniref:hypothetical protein n=1 Tax=Schaalia sp. ZJ1691 TaxID=2709404 RepID=UPI0013ED59E8|nr:hypothetical protein [Schaalia sp. ZJ1691]
METELLGTQDDDAVAAGVGASVKKRRWVPIAIAGIVLAGLATAAGVWAWNIHLDHQALDTWQEAHDAAMKTCTITATDDLDALLKTGDALEDQTVVAKVKDAQAAMPTVKPGEAPTSRAERLDEADALNTKTHECTKATKTLNKAISDLTAAVNEDAQARLDAAVKAATNQITAGNEAIKAAEKKVADDKVRTSAQTTLDALQKLVNKKVGQDASWKTKADHAKALSEKTTQAKDAITKVTDAKVAWEKAQADTQATQAGTNSATGAGTGGGGTTWNGNTTGNTWGGNTAGGSWNGNTNGGNTNSGGSQNLGESGYWYNHNFPEYSYDEDGHRHHQIQPDENGIWVDHLDPIP